MASPVERLVQPRPRALLVLQKLVSSKSLTSTWAVWSDIELTQLVLRFLRFPVGRIHRLLKKGNYAQRVGSGAPGGSISFYQT